MLPSGVEVKLNGETVVVKGPKGQLEQKVSGDIRIDVAGNEVRLSAAGQDRDTRAKWGLYRIIISNMITGVTNGFVRELEITGVGYRAELKGKSLTLAVGYSHPVEIQPGAGITFAVPAPTKIVVSGADKQAVGQVAADIRRIRPPEPYKGKGIRYAEEKIRRKVGKTGAK
jgi:large subunit ribosomal protein L6